MNTIKKICIVTGSRADYGLLRGLIKLINEDVNFELQLFVTGSHLSPQFGESYKEIEEDGLAINRKIDLNLDLDNSFGIAHSTSLALTGFSNAFNSFKPDLLILLGDRYEIFAAAITAMFYQIPIAHIHGGELTEGAIDDAIRHSITKLSHLHFVANEMYRDRVIQLGENPNSVFNVLMRLKI